jgi:hypothetical protein
MLRLSSEWIHLIMVDIEMIGVGMASGVGGFGWALVM